MEQYIHWCERAIVWMQRMNESDANCIRYQNLCMFDLATMAASQVVSCRANYQMCIKYAEGYL